MSNQGTGVPDLDTFLAGQRTGECRACALPPEVTAQITERVARGVRVWAAYSRWLAAQGHEVKSHQLQHHYASGHHERP